MGLTASSCKHNFVQKPNNQPQISGTYGKRTQQSTRNNDIAMTTWNVHTKKRKTRMRWLGDFECDLKKAKVQKEKKRNREQWRLVVEGAKAHPGL
jgi:hypothetical protein